MVSKLQGLKDKILAIAPKGTKIKRDQDGVWCVKWPNGICPLDCMFEVMAILWEMDGNALD